MQRNKSARERVIQFDDSPLFINVQKSILELREIYWVMTDSEFAIMYEKKYRVKRDAVLKVIEDNRPKQY